MSAHPLATELLYTALRSPLGVWVKTPDAHRLKFQLYNARRALADPDLARLRISHNPKDVQGELWLLVTPEDESARTPQDSD